MKRTTLGGRFEMGLLFRANFGRLFSTSFREGTEGALPMLISPWGVVRLLFFALLILRYVEVWKVCCGIPSDAASQGTS